MPNQEKLGYGQLEAGHEFPESRFTLTSAMVAGYIKAVRETSSLYRDRSLVPPAAVAACAQAALIGNISLVPGSIHVAQELDFLGSVHTGATITVRARVSRKQERAGMRLLTITVDVFSQDDRPVMKSKISFIIP